jgi:Spy/CpxP family protein refolding chaperone
MKYANSIWLAVVAAAFLGSAHAADKPAAAPGAVSADMKIFADKVRADKKLLVAANLSLTDAEAAAFWPVYDAYQKDLTAANQRILKAVTTYADAYRANTLTDELAAKLSTESIAIEESEAAMRKTYAAKVAKVLPGKKSALYLQIEGKIRALVRYEMAAQIPLVQ